MIIINCFLYALYSPNNFQFEIDLSKTNSLSTYKGVFHFHNTIDNPIPARLNFSNGLVFNNTFLGPRFAAG
jgi:hypothetical protein